MLGLMTAGLGVMSMAAPGQAAVTNQLMIPLDTFIGIDCTPGGEVDDILHVTGTLHIVTTLTTDEAGGMHIVTESNLQDGSAVGETGTVYRVVGPRVPSTETRSQTNIFNAANEVTGSLSQRFISLGSGVNVIVRFVLHSTIDPDGTVRVAFVNSEVLCVG